MTKRRSLNPIPAALWLSLAALAALPACAAQPTTLPATGLSPATAAAPTPADAAKVLAALERAGQDYHTLRADLEMIALLPALGDREHRTGWVAYRRGSADQSPKIRVHFETLRLGDGPNTRQREDYTFDGRWAVEAKHSVKQLTRWQVAAEGEHAQALSIGKGAFPPLPFGQKAAEVLEYYDAALAPPADSDPPDTDHLALTAHRDRQKELDFVHLDLWVSRTTHLPVKVVGTDKDKNTKTVSLTNVQTNAKLPDDTFELKAGFGWTVNTNPLPPGDQPRPLQGPAKGT